MKFKIIDRGKTGFARYCPTFARAYQVMAENLRRRRLVKNLVKGLGSEDADVRRNAADALGNAAANEKTKEATVREILNFTNSSWFMREAERNSDVFIKTVTVLDRALRKVKEAERKVA